MSKSIFVTFVFLVLSIMTVVLTWYFSRTTDKNVVFPEEYAILPDIELTDAKTTDNFADLVSADSSEHKMVMNSIHTDEYYYFTCKENRSNSQALILVAKYVDQNGINTFDPAVRAFSAFETRLLEDWSEVLFPGSINQNFGLLTFTTKILDNEKIGTNQYRVGLSQDNKTMVYYGLVLNYIVIATNENCLLKTMGELYHVH